MKEYTFAELGYFAKETCENIQSIMEGKTYMNFHIGYSNVCGNCTLIVKTDYDGTEEEIKNFFLGCLLSTRF